MLVVDWDLESPGLHKFFLPFLDESTVSATPGVIEIINDYATASLDPAPRPDDWYLAYARVDRHAVSLEWAFLGEGNARLPLRRAAEPRLLRHRRLPRVGQLLRAAGRRRLPPRDARGHEAYYDYVLIDSRTGLSDKADICTIQMPDLLVGCFTLSDQSIDGAASRRPQVGNRYRNRTIRVLPVPMRIDEGEKEKVDVGRALARLVRGIAGADEPGGTDRLLGGREVPYRPYYAYEETLATFGDEAGWPTRCWRVRAAHRRHDRRQRDRAAADADELRLQCRTRSPAGPRSALTQVYLSYAAENRMWADWTEAVLTRTGCRVMREVYRVTAERGRLEAERILRGLASGHRLLSASYLHSPDARSLWRALPAAEAAGAQTALVPLRVDDVRHDRAVQRPQHRRLGTARRRAGAARLLRALDRPAQLAGAGSAQARAPLPRHRPPDLERTGQRTRASPAATGAWRRYASSSAAACRWSAAQALYGLGGVGKTHLALEYVHRFMADYDLVWWVPSEKPEDVVASLAELGRIGAPRRRQHGRGGQEALEDWAAGRPRPLDPGLRQRRRPGSSSSRTAPGRRATS